MDIVIKEQKCLKHQLTVEETIALLMAKYVKEKDFSNLVARDFLESANGKFTVTNKGEDKLKALFSNDLDDKERLKYLAKQMQLCFPEGKIPGTAYYYRCNISEIVRKLQKFFLQYGNYPDEQIIDATKRFVASFAGKYKYLPLIKYFISKLKPITEEDGTVHNVEYSPLADYLENKDTENSVTSDDWFMNARN